jgi:hypothetical protein
MVARAVVMDECREQSFIGEDAFTFLRDGNPLLHWFVIVGKRRQ